MLALFDSKSMPCRTILVFTGKESAPSGVNRSWAYAEEMLSSRGSIRRSTRTCRPYILILPSSLAIFTAAPNCCRRHSYHIRNRKLESLTPRALDSGVELRQDTADVRSAV